MITITRFIILSLMSMFSSIFVGIMVFVGLSLGGDAVHPQLLGSVVLWSGAIIITLTVLAASPLGDSVVGVFFPIRRQSLREEKKINPALKRIQQLYRNKYGKDISVNVCVMDLPNIDGLSLGQETVAVSTGLLKVANDAELEATIAHELGHLHYGDGVYNLTSIITSLPIVFISAFLDKFVRLVPMPRARMMFGKIGIEWLINMSIAALLIVVILFCAVMKALIMPVLWALKGFEMVTAWQEEYRADRFAGELGYGAALVSLLERKEDEDVRGETGFLRKYFYAHPPTALRIDKLERMMGELI